MSTVGNRTYVIDKSEHIRHMGHSNNLRLFRDLCRNILCREVAVLREIDVLERCAACLCDELPRNNIAVMLRDRNDNLIALTDICTSIAVCNEI